MSRTRTPPHPPIHTILARRLEMPAPEEHQDVYASLRRVPRARKKTSAAKKSSKSRVRKPSVNGVRLWETLEGRINPTKFRPKLADDVERAFFNLRWGNDYGMIANPRDVIHFRLEPDEFHLLDMMDGTRTVEQIVLERLHDSGDLDLSGVIDLVTQLNVGNFLVPPFNDVEEALFDKIAPKPTFYDRARNFIRTLRLDWTGAESFVLWLYNHGLRFAFEPSGVIVTAGVALAGFIAFVFMFAGGRTGFTGEQAASEGLILLGFNLLLVFFHELGHAASLVYYGRRVKSAGFLIYFGSPAFFIESSESLMLDKNKRIMQSAVGPYAQSVFAGIAALIALALPSTLVGQLAYKLAILNYLVIFLNLIPLLELDGYWILSDLIQVPDLRPRSLSFVRHDLIHKLRTREPFSKQEAGLAAYGVLGVLFTVFSFYTATFFWRHVFGGLVGSLWNGGITGQVILAVIALFLGGPILRGLSNMVRWLLRRVDGLYRQLQFRREATWRVEAGEMIDALPLFDDVPVEALNELAGSVTLKRVNPGQPVVRQGERATAFYVIRRGELNVIEEGLEQSNNRILRTLGKGDSFGEMAVLTAATRRATVRAVKDSEVFEIDKSSFDQFLARMIKVPHFGPTFQDMAELRELPCFAHLEQDQLSELLKFGEWVSFAPGDTILKQGDVADTFYAVGTGQVDVLEKKHLIATLGPGSYFGEVGLLLHVRRTATVRAKTPVRLYRLERKGFDRLVKSAFKRGVLASQLKARRSSTH